MHSESKKIKYYYEKNKKVFTKYSVDSIAGLVGDSNGKSVSNHRMEQFWNASF